MDASWTARVARVSTRLSLISRRLEAWHSVVRWGERTRARKASSSGGANTMHPWAVMYLRIQQRITSLFGTITICVMLGVLLIIHDKNAFSPLLSAVAPLLNYSLSTGGTSQSSAQLNLGHSAFFLHKHTIPWLTRTCRIKFVIFLFYLKTIQREYHS